GRHRRHGFDESQSERPAQLTPSRSLTTSPSACIARSLWPRRSGCAPGSLAIPRRPSRSRQPLQDLDGKGSSMTVVEVEHSRRTADATPPERDDTPPRRAVRHEYTPSLPPLL